MERARFVTERAFDDRFVELFHAHFQPLQRYLTRLSGEPELAADLAQDAFLRLYRRGSAPDSPAAWLITVATNLFRNDRSKRARHLRLLTTERSEEVLSDPPPSPLRVADSDQSRERVRAAVDRLPERDRSMLLLRAEGYSYRDIAAALEINEASVGTLLARAKRAFLEAYGEVS
jgi:RNA polymerase sigma-70 factor (ECF subfamily)